MRGPSFSYSTDNYKFAHGKAPRGYGLWGFNVEVCMPDGRFLYDVYFVHGTLSAARDEVKRDLRAEFPYADAIYIEVGS